MRILIFHVDSFSCTATEKGRSRLVEPPGDGTFSLQDGLLVLCSVERLDEPHPERVAEDGAAEVVRLARQLRVGRAMVHPFAHLFAEPADPDMAVLVLDRMATLLRQQGLEVTRTPFGWFYSWDLKAKGHPLSRVARMVRVEV